MEMKDNAENMEVLQDRQEAAGKKVEVVKTMTSGSLHDLKKALDDLRNYEEDLTRSRRYIEARIVHDVVNRLDMVEGNLCQVVDWSRETEKILAGEKTVDEAMENEEQSL